MQKDKLEKLEQFINFLSGEQVTKEEFLKSFKKVINHTLKIETKLIEKINSLTIEEKEKLQNLEKEFNKIIEQAKIDSDNSLLGFKRKTIELVNSLFAKNKSNQKLNEILSNADSKLLEINKKISFIKNGEKGKQGEQGEQGESGKDADEKKIIKEILEKIELPKLDEDAIKKLRDDIEELQRRPAGRLGGGGFSKIHLEQHFIDNELLGIGDDVTKLFNLDFNPNPSTPSKVVVGGGELFITDDWTISGKAITFTTAPPSGAKIRASYRK